MGWGCFIPGAASILIKALKRPLIGMDGEIIGIEEREREKGGKFCRVRVPISLELGPT